MLSFQVKQSIVRLSDHKVRNYVIILCCGTRLKIACTSGTLWELAHGLNKNEQVAEVMHVEQSVQGTQKKQIFPGQSGSNEPVRHIDQGSSPWGGCFKKMT